MPLAPIALFVYNRPDHTRQTVAALTKNELAAGSDLIILSDAAKNEATAAKVDEVRAYLKTIDGFKSVKIIERPENFGLAKSIISGVTEIVNQSGKIIVLEDDLITSPYFLRYMNEALDLYEKTEKVISIHGYIYPTREKLPETFFIKGADCWGWATWKRGWDLFQTDGRKLLAELKRKKLTKKLDFDGAYPFTQMLIGQIRGFNDSWAIRWYASAFLEDKLTLYPGQSLVANIGFDNSGTHGGATAIFDGRLGDRSPRLTSLPLTENEEARQAINRYFKSPRLRLTTLALRLKFYFKTISK